MTECPVVSSKFALVSRTALFPELTCVVVIPPLNVPSSTSVSWSVIPFATLFEPRSPKFGGRTGHMRKQI